MARRVVSLWACDACNPFRGNFSCGVNENAMRQIGALENEQQARRIVDYLTTEGISAQADSEGDGWAIWVRDENQVDSARAQLEEFVQNPDLPKYRAATDQAEKLRSDELRRRTAQAKRMVDMRQQWSQPLRRRAPLTFALIGLSVFASLVTYFGELSSSAVFNTLMFTDFRIYQQTGDGLLQIKEGQIWRLVTPIFLHGGWIHLLFNMSWMYYLGALVEIRCGTVRMGIMALVMAVVSNVSQYVLGPGPNFLGMSGVVYGLFGYVWLRSRLDPRSGFFMPDSTVFIMIFFLVLGFAGGFGGVFGGAVANWAHAGGLGAGVALAGWDTSRRKS